MINSIQDYSILHFNWTFKILNLGSTLCRTNTGKLQMTILHIINDKWFYENCIHNINVKTIVFLNY